MKKCSKCKVEKDDACFSKNGSRLRSSCKDCSRKNGVIPQNKVINGSKLCSKCQTIKSLNEYFKRSDRPSGISSMCKVCEKLYRDSKYKTQRKVWNADHYLRNKDKIIIRSKLRTVDKVKYIISLKDSPCVDCGQKFPPECMDFDHILERGPKSFNLSDASWQSKENIDKEVAKCDLVCSNCHRMRTKNRGQCREAALMSHQKPQGV